MGIVLISQAKDGKVLLVSFKLQIYGMTVPEIGISTSSEVFMAIGMSMLFPLFICPSMVFQDGLFWHGHNSVAQGYKWLLSNRQATSSNLLGTSVFPWKDYWKSKVPHGVLVLVWRIIWNAIPTGITLQKHHIGLGQEALCLFCGQHDETIDHIFMNCPLAKTVWFGLSQGFLVENSGGSTVVDWINLWIQKWKRCKDVFEDAWITVLITLDVLWFYRNKCLWRAVKINPITVINEVSCRKNMYDLVWQKENYQGHADGLSKEKKCFISLNFNLQFQDIFPDWLILQKICTNHGCWIFSVKKEAFGQWRICMVPDANGHNSDYILFTGFFFWRLHCSVISVLFLLLLFVICLM